MPGTWWAIRTMNMACSTHIMMVTDEQRLQEGLDESGFAAKTSEATVPESVTSRPWVTVHVIWSPCRHRRESALCQCPFMFWEDRIRQQQENKMVSPRRSSYMPCSASLLVLEVDICAVNTSEARCEQPSRMACCSKRRLSQSFFHF